jgi:O-antigen ligase
MTSVVVLVGMVALFAVVWSIRGRPTLAVVVALALTAGCVGLTWAWKLGDGLGELASLLERDPTLSGRTALWELLLELVWDRPWLGYGYEAFWTGDKGTYVHLVVRWFPMQAHNGFLNVLLDFGSIGLLLLLVHFARCGVRAFVRTQTDPGAGPECTIWFILFCVIFTGNITESSLFARNDFTWVAYIVMSHKLASKDH